MALTTAIESPMAAVAARRDRWFLPVVIALLLLVPVVPGLVARASAPPGLRYAGVPHAGQDANFYYSFVRQARDGRWMFQNLHTTEPHAAALVNVQWLAVGMLGRLTGWPDESLDHAWRGLGILMVLGAFWALLGRFVRDAWLRRVAFLAFAVGGGFGWIFVALRALGVSVRWDYPTGPGGFITAPFDTFAGIPFQLMFQSFHVASFGLFLVAVLLFLRGEETGRTRCHVGASVLGVVLALSHPYEAVTLAGTVALYAAARRRDAPLWSSVTARRVLPAFASGLALAYWPVLYAIAPTFRWQPAFPPALPLHTLVALGAAAVLAIANLRPFFAEARRGRPAFLLVASLLVANLAFYYAYPFLGTSGGHRNTLMAPLVLVAASRLDLWWAWLRPMRGAALVVAAALVVNALTPAVGLAQRVRHPGPFVDARLLAVTDWLADHAAPGAGVLAPPEVGHWMPARTGLPVYLGTLGWTTETRERERAVRRFYDTAMSAPEREAWLRGARVRYVVFAPAPSVALDPREATYLAERFSASGYAVYEVLSTASPRRGA
jgi:hypothetical protein